MCKVCIHLDCTCVKFRSLNLCDESVKSITCAFVMMVLAHNRQNIQTAKADIVTTASSSTTLVL